jgi:Ca2+-binding RTX toxin-like protein
MLEVIVPVLRVSFSSPVPLHTKLVSSDTSFEEHRVTDDLKYLVYERVDWQAGRDQIVRLEVATGNVEVVSVALDGKPSSQGASSPSVSSDGRYILFKGSGNDLVEGVPDLFAPELFIRDMVTGKTSLVSVDEGGRPLGTLIQGPLLSANGQVIAFSNEESLYARNLTTGQLTKFKMPKDDQPYYRSTVMDMSADGRYFLVIGGDGGTLDVSVRDMETGAVTPISKSGNTAFYQDLSASGRYVVFETLAKLLPEDNDTSYDIYRKDVLTGELQHVSKNQAGEGDTQDARMPFVSADGRYVTFTSSSQALVPNQTDRDKVFVKDMVTGDIAIVSQRLPATGINPSEGTGVRPYWISDDGQTVMYSSNAKDLGLDNPDGMEQLILTTAGTLLFKDEIDDGRYLTLNLEVEAGSDVGVDWGDGSQDRAAAKDGSASLTHTFSTIAAHAGTITVVEGEQTWIVPHTFDVAAKSASRNVALVDTLNGGDGADTLNGDGFNNALNGLGGDDILNGGAGIDVMAGGLGKDTFVVDAVGDVVSDTGGFDTVKTSVSYTTSAGIESLVATSAAGLVLTGDTFANTLVGGVGNDRLFGKGGKDVLTGGAGKDTFVFDTAVAKKKNADIDKITDFNVKADTIWLDNKIFKALGKKGTLKKPAKLDKDAFWTGSKAHDADDRVIYNNKNGKLYYDADGTGSKAAIQIGTLTKKLKATEKDFFVV